LDREFGTDHVAQLRKQFEERQAVGHAAADVVDSARDVVDMP